MGVRLVHVSIVTDTFYVGRSVTDDEWEHSRCTWMNSLLVAACPGPHVSFTVSRGIPGVPTPQSAVSDPANLVSRNTPGPSSAVDVNLANSPPAVDDTMLMVPCTGPAPGAQAVKQIW
jgi:hypothetical protein